jgi:phosphatidylethanolamine-binding protein (PEBP) family uncharacterized protein
MRYFSLILTLILLAPFSLHAQTAPAPLTITSSALNGGPILDRFASCIPDGKGATRDGENISPAISWEAGPAGTQSYALVVVDKDVPANLDIANKPGKMIAANAPRRNFYHWVLIDIPTTTTGFLEGVGNTGVGVRKYRGPCPPWNDERVHGYHFMVYALDVPSLGLTEDYTGDQVEKMLARHVLASGEIVGTYTNNPRLR